LRFFGAWHPVQANLSKCLSCRLHRLCNRVMRNTSGHRPCHRATLPRGKPVAKAPGGPFAPAGLGTIPPLVRAARVFAEASRAGGGTRVALPGPAQRGNPVPRTGKRLPAGWRSDCCFSTLSGRVAQH